MVRLFVLLISCVLTSGCFVFDEIDAGRESMEKHSPKKPGAAPADSGAAGEKAGPPAGDAWWATAKSLSGPPSDAEGDNPAVTCKIGASTRFMRKNDCLSQGGHPKS